MIFFLLILMLPASAPAASLGVNIDMPERGGTYINVVEEGWRWSRLQGGEALQSRDFGTNGWPKVDAAYTVDWRPVAEWAGQVDDSQAYRPEFGGTYKGSFEGKAVLRSGAEGRVANLLRGADGVTRFDFVVPQGSKGFFVFEFSGLQDFGKFKLLRPGYADDKAIFHKPLLEALQGVKFSTLRTMNFTQTNSADDGPGKSLKWGAPVWPAGKDWDRVLLLANLTQTDPWINIPLSADPAYVEALARHFKERLDPRLDLYVESSNEVWNTAPGFPQSRFNQADARRRGIGEHENHARRTVELALAFEKAFGKGSLNHRVRVVLCSHQPMLEWWMEPMLQYIKAKHGEPSTLLWGIACQTYFGAHKIQEPRTAAILQACRADISSQLDEAQGNKAGRRQWAAKARAWGLPGGWLSYEGGPDHGGGDTRFVAERIAAERSPEMGGLMRFNLDEGFAKLGGSLAMQFTLSSGYNRYGCWGLTDDVNIPRRNSKYEALKGLALDWALPAQH